MKRIKMNIDDLISVLEQLKEGNIETVYLFELDDCPALADADDPEGTIIKFDTDEEDEGGLH